jgi:hypothetical protein
VSGACSSAGYFTISQVRRASRRRRRARRRDLQEVRSRQVGGPLPYPLRIANRDLGRGSRGVLPVRMGPHGTAFTRIVRPTALGSLAVGRRLGSLQGRSVRRHGLRYARRAHLRPRVARGAASCRLLRNGGVAGSAPQAAPERFLRPAQTAAALRRGLSHAASGTGQTIWIRLYGPRLPERGYREISVSDVRKMVRRGR